MSFFLKERSPEEQAQVDKILTSPIPTFGERVVAQTRKTRIEKNLNDQRGRVEKLVLDEVKGQIPPEYISQSPSPDASLPLSQQNVPPSQRHDDLFASIEKAKAANPKFGNLPANIEEFDAEVDRRRRAELDEAQDVLDLSDGFAAELIGDVWAEVSTPESLPFLMMGAGAGWRLGATMAAEGLAAGLDEGRTISTQFDVAEELGIDDPKPFQQVGVAVLTGAGLAGALVGGGKALSYGIQRANTTGARRPASTGQLEFSDAVDEAEAALQTGVPPEPKQQVQPTNDPSWTFKALPQPTNWPAIKNGIFVGESGGDYNALFGYQNRRGGRYENVQLTKMTVDQAIKFSNVRGEYGQWVKRALGASGQRARVATPMGAYQIVGTTLRAAKNALGLKGDEVMSEALQDQLGIWIYRQQGTGAWEGYRGPRANGPTARDPNAPAPRVTDTGGVDGDGFVTTRQYTRDGQVTAGDDFRIDVDYEVVELSSLTRASGDLQPRDRSRASSDEQINEIAAGLDPARLMPSPEADRGAPIVGPDSIIESGNGRIAGISRAYDRFPDRAAAYRQQIEAAGFDVPEGVSQPVLVARRTSELTPEQRSGFVRQANVSSTARMSATERAAIDARAIDSETVSMFDPTQPLSSKGNVPFTQRFLSKLPQSERNALVGASGTLNAEGVTRVRQALFGRAFDAPDILARYAEADAGDLRSLMDALEISAPAWAGMRNAISEGRVRADLDVTPFVMDAMRLIADARHIATRENKASAAMVEELMNDVDLLEGATAPLTAALVRMFYPNGRAAPAAKVSAFLDRFAAEAQKVGRTDASLFDDTVSDIDVLKAIDTDAFGKLKETGTARIPDRTPPQPRDVPSDAMPANAFTKGADAPEAQEAADEIAEALRSKLNEIEDPVALHRSLTDQQPFDDFDTLYRLARSAQADLDVLGKEIAADLSVEFRNPGLKKRPTAEEKMRRKSYKSIRQMTDISRGGFVVQNSLEADMVVARLAEVSYILDEGWAMTPAGYADRKLLVRNSNGVISEVQIWSPELLKAKEATGHGLYAKLRSTQEPEIRASLEAQMRELYASALAREDQSFSAVVGTSIAPNVRSNFSTRAEASGKTRPVSKTSEASTDVQDPPGSSKAIADTPPSENRTAGRPSQSQNSGDVIKDTSGRKILKDNALVNAGQLRARDAGDAQAIRELLADLGDDGDIDVPQADGTTLSTRQILDDLDQDEALQTVIDACTVKGTA